MPLRISCIIPAFNAERYIDRSLHSVLEQSLPPDEIIVVDDGSSDATPEKLASYGDKLRVVRQENAGPAAARNRGIEAARGEFICFQDADDEWQPEKLAKQMTLLESSPETDMCITHIKNLWAQHLDSEREALKNHISAQDPPGYVFQTLLARRRVFEIVGMLDEQLRRAEDVDWYSRAKNAGTILQIVPEVLVYRYLHGENISDDGATASERHAQLLEITAARLKERRQADSREGKK